MAEPPENGFRMVVFLTEVDFRFPSNFCLQYNNLVFRNGMDWRSASLSYFYAAADMVTSPDKIFDQLFANHFSSSKVQMSTTQI